MRKSGFGQDGPGLRIFGQPAGAPEATLHQGPWLEAVKRLLACAVPRENGIPRISRTKVLGAGLLVLLALAALVLGSCMFATATQAPRILFMGNSITLNRPFPDVGWNSNWGMAATAQDKDYMHQTLRLLKERGLELEGHIADRDCPECDGALDEQIHNMDQVERLKPRYVVVQLSEHSGDIELRSGKMTGQYRRLLKGLTDLKVPNIYCLGSWGEKDAEGPHAVAIGYALRDFPSVRFLPIHQVSADPANYGDTALFKDPGVLWHPGDAGMLGMAKVLADAVWEDR